MNRHERRAAKKQGEAEFPPGYVEQIERMARWIRTFVSAGARPVFALPPNECMLIAEIGPMLERICVNDDAQIVARRLVDEAPAEKAPTVFMLRVALEHHGFAHLIERRPVEHFTAGLELLPLQPGGEA